MRRSPSPLPTITVLWDFITLRTDIYYLGAKVDVNVKAVFTSRKLSQTLSVKENKPPIVNTQCVVYLFQCDLSDANYIGYTARHLHQRLSEHLEAQHGNNRTNFGHLFKVLRKCNSKFVFLVYAVMLYIKDIKPSLIDVF